MLPHGSSFEQLLLDGAGTGSSAAASGQVASAEAQRGGEVMACSAEEGDGRVRHSEAWVDFASRQLPRTPPAEREKIARYSKGPAWTLPPSMRSEDQAEHAELAASVYATAKEVGRILTNLEFEPPHGRPLAVALNMAHCALLKQWPVRTAVHLAIQEGARFAGYLGYPCWSSTAPALIVAAWAIVVATEDLPFSETARELNYLTSNLQAMLPSHVFGPTSLLTIDSPPKPVERMDEFF